MMPDFVPAAESLSKPEFHCHFCGSSKLTPAFTFPDWLKRATQIYLCRECSCLIPCYDLDASRPAVLRLQTEFWEAQWPDLTIAEAERLAVDCAGIANYYAPWLKAEGGLLLEIGAGRGGLMEALRRQGFTVMGCEPAVRLAELARNAFGFDEKTLHLAEAEVFLKRLCIARQRAQAVFLWHVLEHIPEPYSLLRRVAGILNDGGFLIGQVPLLDRDYIYEAHLVFLNEPAFHHAALKCGFTVEQFNYDINNRFMGFVLKKAVARRSPFEIELPPII